MPSHAAAGRRGVWCVATCAEYAALREVKILRLLAKEDETVVKMAERMRGLHVKLLRNNSFETFGGDGAVQQARRVGARGGGGSSASTREQRKAARLREKWLERNGSWQKLQHAVLLGVHLRRWVARFRARRAAAPAAVEAAAPASAAPSTGGSSAGQQPAGRAGGKGRKSRRRRAASPGEREARRRAEDPGVAQAAAAEWEASETRRAEEEAEVEALGDGAAALYAAGGPSTTAAELGDAVQAALRRGDYGGGDAAAARAWRSFSSAQAILHGGLDEVEAPWSSLGRPPEQEAERRRGLGYGVG